MEERYKMDEARLNHILKRFTEIKLLLVGDFFLDKYLHLDRRLSETSLETGLEAYQVVAVRCSPGAAGTVANNLRALDVQVTALGVIGDDGEGYELQQALAARGVDTGSLIVHPDRFTPTYTKPMMREEDGRVHELNRLDIKNRSPLPDSLQAQIIERLRALAPTVDGVIVADQVPEANCGVVTDRVRATLAELGQRHPGLVIAVDSRERIGLFRHVVLKPNAREALLGVGGWSGEQFERSEVKAAGAALFRQTGRPVFVTIGAEGILVFTREGVQHVPGVPVTGPIDIVGAGDSTMAGIVAALCAGAEAGEAALVGNLVASITIQQIGTTGTASRQQVLERFRQLAQEKRLADDPHRPQYHFLPPANWMNDPNGLIQWRGQYHLFYQHNPGGPCWGTMHWGHAVSENLVHWTDLPIALAPTPGGPDADGCWSGCAVDNDGIPTLIYTGVFPQRQCIATSTDDLLTWEKHAGNPVIVAPPEGLDVTGFRDPCVWREGDRWYALIGSGIQGVGGTVLLYKSPDLIHWEYVHPLCVGDHHDTGEMWECPDLFPLGPLGEDRNENRYVLLVSIQPEFLYAHYFIGTYADHKFVPDIHGIIDSGGYFYAPQTLLDDQGRRIMWGWIKEGRSDEAQQAGGWAGVMSLPRILSLRPGGLLGIEPAPELRALRGKHYRLTDIVLTPTSSGILEDVRGDCLEIVAEFEPGDVGTAEELGLKLRCSPDGEEQTRIVYDRAANRLIVDRERSSLSSDVHRDAQVCPLDLVAGESLKLHIFLDCSVVEVYANGRTCITSRIYPSRPDSLGVDVFASGGSVMFKSLDIWEMGSAITRTH